MNEYLMYQLWQQREERMPHELERQRVVEERMLEQKLEREFAVSPEYVVAEANADDYALVDE